MMVWGTPLLTLSEAASATRPALLTLLSVKGTPAASRQRSPLPEPVEAPPAAGVESDLDELEVLALGVELEADRIEVDRGRAARREHPDPKARAVSAPVAVADAQRDQVATRLPHV